jgi:hypothetical protein
MRGIGATDHNLTSWVAFVNVVSFMVNAPHSMCRRIEPATAPRLPAAEFERAAVLSA